MLASQGATVAVHYLHSEQDAKETVEALRAAGGEAECFKADLSDPIACEELVSHVVGRFGALHILVNNVGNYIEKNVLELTPTEWREILASNLDSAFYMSQQALIKMGHTDYGRVINLGFAGSSRMRASLNSTPYVIAKNGVLTLTRTLAVAVGAKPITVNMVSPGVLENSVTHPPLKDVPKGRWGQPEDMESAIAYLLSPQANYVTGQHIEVAGGWNL
jgi:3-oxoacyl-[acyl-carrier protein] reductase